MKQIIYVVAIMLMSFLSSSLLMAATTNTVTGLFQGISCGSSDGCFVHLATDNGESKSMAITDSKLIQKYNDEKFDGKKMEIKYVIKKGGPTAIENEEFVTAMKVIDIKNRGEKANSYSVQPFNNLSKFGGAEPDALFKDKKIRQALKNLLGKNYTKLVNNLSVSNGISINDAGALECHGCAPHLCSIEGAKLYIEISGGIYVGILTNGNKVLYYTNNTSYKNNPIEPIIQFARNNDLQLNDIIPSK